MPAARAGWSARYAGDERWFFIHLDPASTEAGTITHVTTFTTEITELRAVYVSPQVEALLREMHQRVKNNLHIISSLLDIKREGLPDVDLEGYLQDLLDSVFGSAPTAPVALAVAIRPLPADLDPSTTSSSLGLNLVEGMTGELGGTLPVRSSARQPQFMLYGLFYELVYRQVLSFRFYCKLSVQLRPQTKIEPSRVWLLRGNSLIFTPRDVVIH